MAIPVLAAAALLRIPALLWEGNASPRSQRAPERAPGHAPAASPSAPPRAVCRHPAFVTGTPIRGLRWHATARLARARLGLRADLPVMLVFGGSQEVPPPQRGRGRGHRRPRRALLGRAHHRGRRRSRRPRPLRAALPERARRTATGPSPSSHEDMDAALAAADLLVGRAGSSTLAEAAAAGVPMMVVPYPHAAAHQRANAAEMVEAGAAILVDDEDLDGDTLREACDLLFDASPRLDVGGGPRRSADPASAAATAAAARALAAREPLPTQAELDAAHRGGAVT